MGFFVRLVLGICVLVVDVGYDLVFGDMNLLLIILMFIVCLKMCLLKL